MSKRNRRRSPAFKRRDRRNKNAITALNSQASRRGDRPAAFGLKRETVVIKGEAKEVYVVSEFVFDRCGGSKAKGFIKSPYGIIVASAQAMRIVIKWFKGKVKADLAKTVQAEDKRHKMAKAVSRQLPSDTRNNGKVKEGCTAAQAAKAARHVEKNMPSVAHLGDEFVRQGIVA